MLVTRRHKVRKDWILAFPLSCLSRSSSYVLQDFHLLYHTRQKPANGWQGLESNPRAMIQFGRVQFRVFFAPLPLSLIKCGYSLGWDRKTLHSLQLFWFKKRVTLLTQCPVKPFLGVLFYYVIIILILSFNEQQLCLARLSSLFNFIADWKQAAVAAYLPYTNC